MKDVAVVPLKSLPDAKRRLSNHLGPDERRRLVLAMLEDVLRALDRSELFTETLVVSSDESLEKQIARNHAIFVEQKGAGLNAAVRQAMRQTLHDNASSLTTVLADLPLVEPRDFQELAHIGRERHRVVLAPSSKGGTNVMARSPPDIIQNVYGRWSYAKHLRAAQHKGISVYSISNARLCFDVDTIQDLRSLRRLDPSGKTNTGRAAREIGRFSPTAKTM